MLCSNGFTTTYRKHTVTTDDEFWDDADLRETPLLTDLKTMLRNHAHSHPRHLQVALGPSEIGHPCARTVIQGLLARPIINPKMDPLPSYIGVAAHKAMEEAARLDNARLLSEGQPSRWIPEMKVEVTPGLSGTCDLYDYQTHTVIDYKFPGPTRMTKYRKEGPSPMYRAQAHMYGKGYANKGFPVSKVGIWFLPRGGFMASSYLWTEDYDSAFVGSVVGRYHSLILLMDEMELETHPERLSMIPVTPFECQFCEYFTVRDNHPDPAACRGMGYDPHHTDR